MNTPPSPATVPSSSRHHRRQPWFLFLAAGGIAVLPLVVTIAAPRASAVAAEPPATTDPTPKESNRPPDANATNADQDDEDGEATVSQTQASAAELVGTMRRALGIIAKTTQTKASSPDFRTRKARAFAQALAATTRQVDRLAQAVDAKAPDAFQTMVQTGSQIAALQVAFRYNGIEDDDVEDGYEKLAAAYGVFHRNYGRNFVAARTEAQSALSPAQRSALDDLKRHGDALAKRLGARQAILKGNPAAAFEGGAILKGLARLDKVPRSRRGLLDAVGMAEILAGRWLGLTDYLQTVYPDDAEKLLATASAEVRDFEGALGKVVTAAFADEKTAEVFGRPASYAEDLSTTGVTDAELSGLFDAVAKASSSSSPGGDGGGGGNEQKTVVKPDPVADRAEDAEINADDPDDDSSLDLGGEEGVSDDTANSN